MDVYACPHKGCEVVCPAEFAKNHVKWLTMHVNRFEDHRECFETHGDDCSECMRLGASGEWTDDGGYDEIKCPHIGCTYYSRVQRLATRKQTVQRHQDALPIHLVHVLTCRPLCDYCKEMFQFGVWTEEMVEKAKQSSTQRRTITKEVTNIMQPDMFTFPDPTRAVPIPPSLKTH